MNYYLLFPICKKGKIFKIFYDAFDENGRCILSDSTKKTYSFFCCDVFYKFQNCIQRGDNDVLEASIEILNILRNFEKFNLKQ